MKLLGVGVDVDVDFDSSLGFFNYYNFFNSRNGSYSYGILRSTPWGHGCNLCCLYNMKSKDMQLFLLPIIPVSAKTDFTQA